MLFNAVTLWRSQSQSIGTNHDPFQLSLTLGNTFEEIAYTQLRKTDILLGNVGYLVCWACLVGKVGIMWLVHNTATHNSGRWPQMALMSVSYLVLNLCVKSSHCHKHCLPQVFLDFHVTDKQLLLQNMRGKRTFDSEITCWCHCRWWASVSRYRAVTRITAAIILLAVLKSKSLLIYEIWQKKGISQSPMSYYRRVFSPLLK